jgi:hypothetical protein
VVTFIALGTCSLTAHVANGTNYVGADGSAQTFSIGVQVQKYTILFDSEGGTPIGSISSIAGAPIALPTPTFAQETFDGWYLASSGGEALATPYVPIRSVTLFAQWTPIATVDASVPSAPVIRAISTTAHSIVITLVKAPVSGGAPISGYAYSFGGSWLSIAFNGNHQATIHHLHSGAIVVVSVRATNSIGAGPRSHGIRVKVRS